MNELLIRRREKSRRTCLQIPQARFAVAASGRDRISVRRKRNCRDVIETAEVEDFQLFAGFQIPDNCPMCGMPGTGSFSVCRKRDGLDPASLRFKGANLFPRPRVPKTRRVIGGSSEDLPAIR